MKVTGDRLIKIFEKQKKLMIKYEAIEKKNGLLQTDKVPVDINSFEGQARLRDFAWRITEETAEALQVYFMSGIRTIEFKEEISDILHFLVEFTILSGLSLDSFTSDNCKILDKWDILFMRNDIDKDMTIEWAALRFLIQLGMTVNLLKNKAWKQTLQEVYINKFYTSLSSTWDDFIVFAIAAGFLPDSLYEAYMDKNSINQHRQESGY